MIGFNKNESKVSKLEIKSILGTVKNLRKGF